MNDLAELLQSGLEHHRAGRLVEAERNYRHVLDIHPRHAKAFHLLGLVAFQAGKPELAAELIGQAIKIDAFHAPFAADLGEVYRALDRLPEAVASYRKALEINPEMPDAWTRLGVLLDSTGNVEEAAACFHEALGVAPDYAEAHQALGRHLQAQGKAAEALVEFERVVLLAPNDGPAYLDLGRALHAQGRLLDAIACYQKASRLDPSLVEAQQLQQAARQAIAPA